MRIHPTRPILLLPFVALLLAAGTAPAQQPSTTSDAPAELSKTPPPDQTPAETIKWSWATLTDSVQDTKRFEIQTQALNALSSLGSNPHANQLIAAAMEDKNLDVRTAAILAAGKSKSRALVAPTRKLLNDPEPQVVFAAATTLWKQFKDKSGEDVLAAIAAGERKANPNLIHGAEHDITRTLHSPSTLTKIGVETGAALLLGPFGFSVGAVEYARKNGSDSARVESIELLSEEHSEGVHDQMKTALDDKDPGVRAAAAMVLGSYHRASDSKAIAFLLEDSKLPVRLAGAAAYIDSSSATAKPKAPQK